MHVCQHNGCRFFVKITSTIWRRTCLKQGKCEENIILRVNFRRNIFALAMMSLAFCLSICLALDARKIRPANKQKVIFCITSLWPRHNIKSKMIRFIVLHFCSNNATARQSEIYSNKLIVQYWCMQVVVLATL